jgi:hypothetical protein
MRGSRRPLAGLRIECDGKRKRGWGSSGRLRSLPHSILPARVRAIRWSRDVEPCLVFFETFVCFVVD